MPVGKTSSDLGGLISKFFVPFIFVASGLLMYRELVLRLLDDKASRMRENMAMFGLKDSSYLIG